MAELRQYPTDQEIKESYNAYLKGKRALGEYLDKAAARRAAEKAAAEKTSPKA